MEALIHDRTMNTLVLPSDMKLIPLQGLSAATEEAERPRTLAPPCLRTPAVLEQCGSPRRLLR